MSKKIVGVFSGKGGVGKTTIASNLAVILARAKKKVVLVDCNFSASHLTFHFNIHFAPLTLNHVLRKEARLEDVMYKLHGVYIIPASLHPYELLGIDTSRLSVFLKRKLRGIDYVVLDTAPGFGKETLTAAGICEEGVLVTTPDMPSLMDVLRGEKILRNEGVDLKGIVLNKVEGRSYEFSREDVEALSGMDVLGEIPFSRKFQEALSYKIPLAIFDEKSLPALRLYQFVSNYLGEKVGPELSWWDKFRILLTSKLKRSLIH